MKVLLFTHKPDTDGMGNAVLGKLVYKDSIVIEYADNFEINQKIQKYIDDGSINDYDIVYVTDICVKEPLRKFIDENDNLKSKFKVFDHHKSELEDGAGGYNWIKIIVNDKNYKCSGTSLFYSHLLETFPELNTSSIKEFVELIRRYDTWEWKNVYNDEMSHELHILYEYYCIILGSTQLGNEKFVNVMVSKLLENNTKFEFSNDEKEIINQERINIQNYIIKKESEMAISNLLGNITGTVTVDRYRNDIASCFYENNKELDIVAMVDYNRNTISFRTGKDIDISEIARRFEGKGHRQASSCPIGDKILNILFNELEINDEVKKI